MAANIAASVHAVLSRRFGAAIAVSIASAAPGSIEDVYRA
jgi:hypothetical protein